MNEDFKKCWQRFVSNNHQRGRPYYHGLEGNWWWGMTPEKFIESVTLPKNNDIDNYYYFDNRAYGHPGVVIDIGCLEWDWSAELIKKGKKVIGFDPQENSQPLGAELRKKAVVSLNNKVKLSKSGQSATIMGLEGIPCDTACLHDVLKEFKVMPSLIKMNIEGAEYPLLFSLREPPADQLIISFHDWDLNSFPYSPQLSQHVRDHLSIYYNWTITCKKYSWWMGLLKDEFRVKYE